jgi:hypothetical protein
MNTLMSKSRTAISLLETSIAIAGQRDEAAEFRATLGEYSHPLIRMAARTMVGAAMAAPKTTGRLIRRSLPEGMTYAGAGWHSVAYRIGDEVVKVNKRSVQMPEMARLELAASEQERHGVLKDYLGNISVPQTVDVAAHPAIPHARAVQIRQPFYSYGDLGDVFSSNQSNINTNSLTAILREHPELDESFFMLGHQGLTMAEETGLAPDIIRRGNLGITADSNPELIMVDGQPVGTEGPSTQNYILPQLEQLSQFLDPVHA